MFRGLTSINLDEKGRLALAAGASDVVVYTREDFAKRVKELTKGEGVPVVYDSVGKATFQGSLDCLRPRGLMVTFGNASGPVPPLDLLQLSAKGSLFVTRPTLAGYTSRREELEEGRELYRSRVAPDLFARTNFYDRAICDVILKAKGHVKSKIW